MFGVLSFTFLGSDKSMIRDVAAWRAWEEAGPLREPADFAQNLRLLDAMYELARTLGAIPFDDPLAGLETDIRTARILNHVRSATGENREGT
jgi:hypothetical protein